MARFLVSAMPFTGHVRPMREIAAALIARGHQVRFYTGSSFRAGVEAVVILDGRRPHAMLVELFSEYGAGTLVTAG